MVIQQFFCFSAMLYKSILYFPKTRQNWIWGQSGLMCEYCHIKLLNEVRTRDDWKTGDLKSWYILKQESRQTLFSAFALFLITILWCFWVLWQLLFPTVIFPYMHLPMKPWPFLLNGDLITAIHFLLTLSSVYLLLADTHLLSLALLGYYLLTGLGDAKENKVALGVHQVFPTWGLALHLPHLLQIILQSISMQVNLESKLIISTGEKKIPLLILVLIWTQEFIFFYMENFLYTSVSC